MGEFILKADTQAADGVHLMHFFLTWYSLWTKSVWTSSVMRCIRVVWHRNLIPPAILSPPSANPPSSSPIKRAKFSGVFCLWQLWNLIFFTSETCQHAENWCLVRWCSHCFKPDSIDPLSASPSVIRGSRALPVALLLVTYFNMTVSWRDDKAIIQPIQNLSHPVAERVTINFLQWQWLSRSPNWD